MKVTYKIVDNAGIPEDIAQGGDDYYGLEIFINGEYEGTLTGYCSKDALVKCLTGRAEELK